MAVNPMHRSPLPPAKHFWYINLANHRAIEGKEKFYIINNPNYKLELNSNILVLTNGDTAFHFKRGLILCF